MLPRSLRCLCLCLAVLMTVSINPSRCHQSFSRRGTPSFSAFSHHRFARRSPPRLSNQLGRRSLPTQEAPSLTTAPSTPAPLVHSRRSIDLVERDIDNSSQSLDQQRDEANNLWTEFVDSADEEDPDSYPDCSDDESAFYLDSNDDQTDQSANDTGKPATTSNSQSQSSSRGQNNGSNGSDDQGNSDEQDNKSSEAAPKKEAERAKKAKKEAGAKAQADKNQGSKQTPDDEQTDGKKKEQEDAEDQKKQDAAKAKKEQDAAEAKKEQDEAKKEQDEAKKEQDEAKEEQAKKEQEEAAQKAKKGKHAYQVTDMKKIPGTSVTTGTATKDETYSSPASSDEHSGDATFFTPDTGACGKVNTSSDYIVAVSHLLYDSFPSEGGNPNTNAVCGKKIRAHYKGRSVVVSVADRCEGCDMYSLDFTESAFQELGSKDEGRLHGMTWTFI